MRSVFAGAVLIALSACNSNSSGNVTAPAATVAAIKPPAGAAWTDMVVATPDGGYQMGNPAAPLKLIEYGSRACPFCAKFDGEGFPALKAKYVATGKASYEFRDYPVHGALDIAPILLGRCITSPATFFPLLDQMFANQAALIAKGQEVDARIKATMANASPNDVALAFAEGLGYLEFVKARGVPEDKARACLADKAGIDAIGKRYEAANTNYQISGTPTFILNGAVIPGNVDWPQLDAALTAAGG
jgi:protein-disulfide isomerase